MKWLHDFSVQIAALVAFTLLGLGGAAYVNAVRKAEQVHSHLSGAQAFLAAQPVWLVVVILAAVLLFGFLLGSRLQRVATLTATQPTTTPTRQIPNDLRQVERQNKDYNPLDSFFAKKVIRIVDLLPIGESHIRSKTFEDCWLYGPANLGVLGHVAMEGANRFNALSVEACLLALPVGTQVAGLIGLDNCTFRRCTFTWITFVGTPEVIETARRGFARSQLPVSSPARPPKALRTAALDYARAYRQYAKTMGDHFDDNALRAFWDKYPFKELADIKDRLNDQPKLRGKVVSAAEWLPISPSRIRQIADALEREAQEVDDDVPL